MALRDHKVDTGSDYTGKDVESLPDAPTITAAQLKARFDSLVKKVVVPKYNALIDELGEPAHTVNGAPAGRLAALDGSGDLTDSGVDADGVEPKRRMCFISANPSQLWFRVLKVTLPQSINAARAVRVQGFSGTPNSNGRGHWEVLLSMTYLGNAYRKKCTITFVDKGITPENFDFRETEQGVYALWFKPLASTMYYLFVTEEGDMNGLTVETFDNDTTAVSGTQIAAEYPDIPGLRAMRTEVSAAANAAYTDVTAAGATTASAVAVMRNAGGTAPRPAGAACVDDGKIRVFWETAPGSAATVDLSLFYTV